MMHRLELTNVNILQCSALSLLRVLKCTILSAIAVKVSVYCSAHELNGKTQNICSVHYTYIWRVITFCIDYAPMHKEHVCEPQITKMREMIPE